MESQLMVVSQSKGEQETDPANKLYRLTPSPLKFQKTKKTQQVPNIKYIL